MAQNRRGPMGGPGHGPVAVEKANDFKRNNKKISKRLSIKI